MRILIVEDDPVIGKSLNQGLIEAGHPSVWVKDGRRGLDLAKSQQFDAVVLDLLLPEIPGIELLRQLRGAGVGTPTILLTALGSVEERVTGLQNGADDYVVKPFALVELLARLEAVCRRSGSRPPAQLQVGDVKLELATRRVTRGDREIDLTPTEFSLLEMLMRYAGQVVTRKMLCEHLWEADWEGATNVIEVHINRLRGKLQRGFTEPLIHTVRGRGYALRTATDDLAIPSV
jgi:two-component system OmpR family response regulator/two-component system copper resistance phosphate regulon response regulator CusR